MPMEERFYSYLRARGLNDITIQKQKGDVEHFLRWWKEAGGQDVAAVRAVDAQAYVRYLQTPIHELRPGRFGAYSSSTIRRKVSVLRQFYDFIQAETETC